MAQAEQPHSAPFLGDYRDFWWNADFLELMAKRLELHRVRRALDVGCGKGHWGQTLIRALPESAHVTGVDREETWIREASERALKLGLGERFTYVQGDANRLPFEDSSFDLVTCQTLLMHVPEPRATVTEMLRVLRPGGLILATEPSNMANEGVSSSFSMSEPVDNLVDRFRFNLTCHRGKMALGLGYSSIGDLLPGIFAGLGIADIRVHIADRASALFPPYDGPGQQMNLQQIREWAKQDLYIADKSQTRRLFLAGGGEERDFDRLWDNALRESRSLASQGASGTYHTGGAAVSYLVSGRRG